MIFTKFPIDPLTPKLNKTVSKEGKEIFIISALATVA
jgi:hypothetical protein